MLIVDGSHLCHRVLHVPGVADLRDSNGRPTGGVHGFLNSLQKTARKYRCREGFVVAWDNGVPQYRRKLDPAYKGWKKDSLGVIAQPSLSELTVDDEVFLERYNFTRRVLHEQILPALGCISVRVTDCEADDIIGQVVMSFKGERKTIITSDKDLYQLLDEETTHYDPIKDEEKTVNDIIQEYDLDPENYEQNFILMKAILGDGSDGIAGIPKVGPARAIQLAKIVMKEGIKGVPTDRAYEKSFHENIQRVMTNIKLIGIKHHIQQGNPELGAEILRSLKLACINRIDPDYVNDCMKEMELVKARTFIDYIIESNENADLFDRLKN